MIDPFYDMYEASVAFNAKLPLDDPRRFPQEYIDYLFKERMKMRIGNFGSLLAGIDASCYPERY